MVLVLVGVCEQRDARALHPFGRGVLARRLPHLVGDRLGDGVGVGVGVRVKLGVGIRVAVGVGLRVTTQVVDMDLMDMRVMLWSSRTSWRLAASPRRVTRRGCAAGRLHGAIVRDRARSSDLDAAV